MHRGGRGAVSVDLRAAIGTARPGFGAAAAMAACLLVNGPLAGLRCEDASDLRPRLVTQQGHSARIKSAAFSPDGSLIATTSWDKTAIVWDRASGKVRHRLNGHQGPVGNATFSPDGKHLLTTDYDGESALLWDVTTGELRYRLETRAGKIDSAAFSPDGKSILIAASSDSSLWETATGKLLHRLQPKSSPRFSPEGALVLSSEPPLVWEAATGKVRHRLDGHSASVHSAAFSANGKLIVTASADSTTRIWDAATGAELCRLIVLDADVWERPDPDPETEMSETVGTSDLGSDRWVVSSPDGRLDGGNFDPLLGLHWVFPDDPLRPIPPEIFLRDYYEPQLLSRVLQGKKLPSVRALGSLNRVQPRVLVTGLSATPDPLEGNVTVQVGPGTGVYQRAEGAVTKATEVYDLRLFRDGQLVGRWPEPPSGWSGEFDPDPTSPEDMRKWRGLYLVKSDGGRVQAASQGTMTISFRVRLPSREKAGPVEFTAYAFNEDRGMSETARFTYQAPASPATTKPRAYLVCFGVSACETPAWNLTFAARDAEVTADALDKTLRGTARYDVVPVVLASGYAAEGRHLASAEATKANLQAVLKLLAGKSIDPAVRDRLPHAQELRRATPDDLLVMTFSGHGYTDPRGSLYLIPHDVGSGWIRVSDALPRCISSGELSAWLREVDAGEAVLVVDACHSAAAVAEPGFKPGPLGNRGLGQLAFDKGMRILAAAQGDEVALESRNVRQGLLTYALVRDGLEHRRAAKAGTITLGGLLTYAAQRVPSLYQEVVQGTIRDAEGGSARQVEPMPPTDAQRSAVQRPELFDYTRGRRDVVLDARPQAGGGPADSP